MNPPAALGLMKLLRQLPRVRGMSSRPPPIAMPSLGTTPKTAEGAIELYDKWASSYDKTLRSWDYPAPSRTAALLKSFLHAAELPVLDAGCGTGLSGEALNAAGFRRIVGADVSQASLDLCRKKAIYELLQQCSLEAELPFADRTFSAAVSVGAFSYVHNFSHLFHELCRVTAPGGIIVFTHRQPLWDSDTDSIQSSAAALSAKGLWSELYVSGPEPYMPRNPDPEESSKRIRYVAYKVL